MLNKYIKTDQISQLNAHYYL